MYEAASRGNLTKISDRDSTLRIMDRTPVETAKFRVSGRNDGVWAPDFEQSKTEAYK